MNNKKSIIMSVALAASMLATSISAFAYTDVSGDHWAKSYIDDLSGKKYLSGYEDGTYKPDNYVTRAEFAKILVSIFGVIDKTGVTLSDVADSAWYADTMKIAVKAGYITGYSDGTVKPEDKISRQEAAVMVYRAWALSPEGSVNFTDANQIADWAANQVATLASKSVINGYSEDGSFRPNNYITRAEVAKIISTAITLGVNKVTTPNANGTTSGMLHVGSTTTHASSGGNSGSGGGGSLTGTPTGDTKKPAKDPEVEEGDKQDVTVPVDTSKAVEAIEALTDETVPATDPVVLQLSIDDKYADDVTVTFLNPITGSKETMTVAKFNDLMKTEAEGENKDKFTKAAVAEIVKSLEVTVPEDAKTDKVDIGVSVEKTDGTTVVEETKATVSINYVIESLKDYQAGKGDNYDLAVVVKLYTDGYKANEKAANKWLEDNAKKLKLYGDVLSDVADVFADEEVTEENYKEFAGYFNDMITVIDDAAEFAADKKGKLTKSEALEYFNEDVADAIKDKVDAEYADEIANIAKAFGVKLASQLDDVNDAVKSGSSKANKIELIWDVYNGDYE